MTKNKMTLSITTLLLFFFIPSQGQSVDPDLLIYGYAYTPKRNHITFTTLLNYTHITKAFDSHRELIDNADIFRLERHLEILHTYTVLEFSVFDRFSIGFEIPYYLYQNEIFMTNFDFTDDSGKRSGPDGVGDIVIFINPTIRKDEKTQSKFTFYYKMPSGQTDYSESGILSTGTGVNDFGIIFSIDNQFTKNFMFSLAGSRVIRQSIHTSYGIGTIDLGDIAKLSTRFTYNIFPMLYTGVEITYIDIEQDIRVSGIHSTGSIEGTKRELGYLSPFIGIKIANNFHSIMVFNFHVHGRNVFRSNVISLGIFLEI